ncbi:lysophospholipid acyltransferase family protein [Legionella feeleii]|uniref:Lipid A biosynthesis acyltransferase n=1 Tax=Legionella feeleii TaxID=453 RepID=A0A378INQ2_9GAMM|nr:lysophospholipid acyltransferase family protein [Legionella feeleii]STX36867.1 lipid A biosynthesis acyltransferase [Legionella feeleii]
MIEIGNKLNQLPVSWAGRFLYYFLPYKKDVVFKNIDLVFQASMGKREKKRFAMAYYSHFFCTLKELIFFSFTPMKRMQQRTEIRGLEHFSAVSARGRGVLLLSAHVGNWEIAPLTSFHALKAFNKQIHCIRKTLKNRFVEKILFQRCEKAGFPTIKNSGALAKVRRALAAKEVVLFFMDQRGRETIKARVVADFFGHKAANYSSLAILAGYTKAPVVPVAFYRLKNGRHVAEFYPEVKWLDYSDKRKAIYYNTLAYNQALERIILQNPEQWIWSYNRWKL